MVNVTIAAPSALRRENPFSRLCDFTAHRFLVGMTLHRVCSRRQPDDERGCSTPTPVGTQGRGTDREGDLRPGGEFRFYIEADDIESTGRVEACEPPRRLVVTARETDESYQRGQGVPPFDSVREGTLTADGDQTILVLEIKGMPLDKVAFYGAGWQIHAETLAAHLAGQEPADVEARWEDLVPPYQKLAASLS
jgi:uncharacterized protein YndB with AHSA1/START domain